MRSRDRVSLHDDDYRLWSIAALLLLNIPWTRGGRFACVYVHRSASVWRRVAISVITFFFFCNPLFFLADIGCRMVVARMTDRSDFG